MVYETGMLHRPPCKICGHLIFAARDHDIPAPRAAKMFTSFTCNCGKPARVRCFNGLGTYFIECEDGHGGRGLHSGHAEPRPRYSPAATCRVGMQESAVYRLPSAAWTSTSSAAWARARRDQS